ncbi:putative AMP-dependent synthetase/ligase, AMP-binding, ANL domain-containing protein [Septoria linicola]|nr:putative AMP-dependent synthetase/ligase, AMP-binding, ANL domain-containing protein [Septoria linicola]
MQDPGLSEDFGGDAEPCPDSLWEWLSGAGSQSREQAALIVPDPKTSKWTVAWDYGSLVDRVEQLAGTWTEAGVISGDRLFVFVDNSSAADWTLLFWLAARLGLTFMPLDPAIFHRPDELKSMISLLKPAAIVVQDDTCVNNWDAIELDYTPKLQRVCSKSSQSGLDWQALDHVKGPAPAAPFPETGPDHVAIIMNTSGSTSLPKCCPVTVRTLVTEIRQYHSMHNSRFTSATKHLVSTSVCRPISYLACVNTWIAGGAAVFTGGAFDADITFRALDKAKCTHAWFVPAMVNILHAEMGEHNLDTLRTVFMSGDTAEAKTIEKAKDLLPASCQFISHWGMSEGAPLFGYNEDEQTSFEKDSGIGGIGRALRGTRVRVCEGDSNSPVKRGNQGALHVKSDAMIGGYLDNRSEEDFYDDALGRWFKTGDTAVMDASGVLYIVGRTKDIIVYKGRNIVPTVVQSYLKGQFPAEWVLVGLKDEVYGEIPALVVDTLPFSKQEVLDYVKQSDIEDSGLKGGIHELKELGFEGWPYNSSNKIQKLELIEAVERARKGRGREQVFCEELCDIALVIRD